jgi:hypothetical protein
VDIAGTQSTTLRGINDLGESVGFYSVENPADPSAVIFHGFKRAPSGSTVVVDLPGASDSALLGINNRGVLVGQFDLGDQSVGGSFVQSRGHFTILSDPPGASPFNVFASKLNDLNVVVGSFIGVDGNQHAFWLRASNYTTFDVPGATVTGLGGINDRGEAVGVSDAIGGFVLDIATSSVSSSIACPDGFETFPEGINNRGQITGRCSITGEPGTPFHAFIATPAQDDE